LVYASIDKEDVALSAPEKSSSTRAHGKSKNAFVALLVDHGPLNPNRIPTSNRIGNFSKSSVSVGIVSTNLKIAWSKSTHTEIRFNTGMKLLRNLTRIFWDRKVKYSKALELENTGAKSSPIVRNNSAKSGTKLAIW
jgi:hypothetical protein